MTRRFAALTSLGLAPLAAKPIPTRGLWADSAVGLMLLLVLIFTALVEVRRASETESHCRAQQTSHT
jgi:hypothetical protein